MINPRTRVIRGVITTCLLYAVTFGLLATPQSARADTFCVGTPGELSNALVLAANLNGSHSVRMRKGVYVMTEAIFYSNDFGGDLNVSGGWNNGCTIRGNDSYETVVDGNDSAGWTFRAQTGPIDVTLELLHFVDFNGIIFWDDFPCGDQQKFFRVARVVLDANPDAGRRLFYFNDCHRIEIENSLIIGGTSGVRTQGRGVPMRIVHNTIIGTAGIGLDLDRTTTGDPSEIELYNNIVYGHGLADVRIDGGNARAFRNMWAEIEFHGFGGFTPDSIGNLTTNPQLAPNGRPIEPNSRAINSGALFLPGGLPNFDVEGNDRLTGSKPDRGAFETAVSDSSQIIVTDPNDNGPGTLRDAIEIANASPGPKQINFSIPGSCPQNIFLRSLLPSLTSDELLTINGYSQPGSSSNTLEHGNNATICIHLRKSSAIPTLSYAVRVPPGSTTQLRLRGIGFGGVGDAVSLAGGNSHLIQGNRFGDNLIGNTSAVKIFSGSNDSLIGGYASNSHRNTIADSSVVGIGVIGSSGVKISNNYIGTNSDGLLAAGNATGISVAGAVGTRISGNVISGNVGSAVVLNGAATADTLIVANRIGIVRESNIRPGDLGNGGAGVRIVNGAQDNRIGDRLLRDSKNIIAYNGAAGVSISTGQGNTITGNAIFSNAGLGIDLADSGVLLNDDDSLGTPLNYANRGLNFPILTGAIGDAASGSVTGSLSSTRGAYRVELFTNASCDGSGHGEGGRMVGVTVVTVPNIPGQHTVEFVALIQSDTGGLSGAISATATDISANTSEFSACIPYNRGDAIFADGYE